MKLTMRNYQSEEDYWRIREFLREVFILNERRELSWQTYRFDYWRWHGIENLDQGPLETKVYLWEVQGGQLAAILNPESKGHANLQVHPHCRSAKLENEMLLVAEEHLTHPAPEDKTRLIVWVNQEDKMRKEILARRGYIRCEESEYQRRRPISVPIPEATIPEGYTVRSLGDVEEHAARTWASWRAFHPNDPDDEYSGWEWYQNIQAAPLYRRDLDIIAVAPGGEIASFCTIWFDDVTRTGAFEPVGTVPEHQRLGLGKALITEGLQRLKRMGASTAHVGSYAKPAHALYASIGFVEYDISQPWKKEF